MRHKIMSRMVRLPILGVFWLAFLAAQATGQTPYYQGKVLTILRGGEPGGTGDLQARALIPFLEKYLPGRPKIVISNMPGAAGRKAANHIYTTAKPDGLTIGAVGAGWSLGRSSALLERCTIWRSLFTLAPRKAVILISFSAVKTPV